MELQEAKKRVVELLVSPAEPDYSIRDFDFTTVMIYGAGGNGKLIYKLLKYLDINIVAFLDRGAKPKQKLYGVPVYHPDADVIDDEMKKIPLVIALDQFLYNIATIVSDLETIGYREVSYNHDVICKANFYYFNTMHGDTSVDLKTEQGKIIQALELLADDMSRNIFVDFIKARLTSDFSATIINREFTACVQVDVPLAKGYAKFLDCGAYTGDTFKDLIEHQKVDTYIGFEPMLDNFQKLSKTVKDNKNRYKQAILYPLGVANENGYIKFDDELDSCSKISDTGKSTIITAKIDDIIQNIAPTMIKMDIEGAEISALMGAKQTIVNYKPDLAICVYHRLSDLWNIPLLINSFNSEYKFYLRCHSIATIETILYVTV